MCVSHWHFWKKSFFRRFKEPAPIRYQLGMSVNVLIAGCGYVGCELARLLHANEAFVVWGLRRSVDKLPAGLVHPIAGDLFNPDRLGNWPKSIDYVVYSAAATSRSEDDNYRDTYVKGLGNIITRLKADGYQPKRILFTSSTHVYHQKDGEIVDENSPTLPESFAGKIMLEAENILFKSPFPGTSIRLGGIYGPDRLWLINQVKAGKGCPSEPVVYTNRIHRDDCAGILAHLIKRDMDKQPVDSVYLGIDNCPVPLHDIMHWIADRLHIDNLDETQPSRRSSKRCVNKRIVDTGYTFKYSDYKAGYATLIE